MKKYIKIPAIILEDILKDVLTRNQILLTIAMLYDDTLLLQDVKSRLYGKSKSRYLKDATFINEKYYDIVIALRNKENEIKTIKNDDIKKVVKNTLVKSILRARSNKYYKMKIETFKNMVGFSEGEIFSYNDIKVTMYFIKLYLITYKREYEVNLNDLIIAIFGKKHIPTYKSFFIQTLNKLMSLEYADNSKFIKFFEIQNKRIKIVLDSKNKTVKNG